LKTYYDTGVLLKLYTSERDSGSVGRFVHSRRERLFVTELHISESVSALKLKVFRGECREDEAAGGIATIMDDLKSGVLHLVEVDWILAWQECRLLSERFAPTFGVRTLDALHVGLARLSRAEEFVTSDSRQSALALRIGLHVIDPTRHGRGK
jgi:predicted nucleic acid-binding protein